MLYVHVPVKCVAAIIADDLTGANDSAAHFAQQDWDTRLILAAGSG